MRGISRRTLLGGALGASRLFGVNSRGARIDMPEVEIKDPLTELFIKSGTRRNQDP